MFAIGNHFQDFSQVSDDDVVAALRESAGAPVAAQPRKGGVA
jgi:predicted phosphoribosyltransferase